jgi:hypothetical protein
MAASGAKALPAIGFLTVVEHADRGLTGGLLVLNAAGRPLEFHCTAPLKPNRAQQILYGPTLRPFLYGEQIGQTLLSKAKCEPLFACTDVEPAMCVRDLIALPVVLLLERTAEPRVENCSKQRTLRFDSPHSPPPPAMGRVCEFTLGAHTAAVLTRHETDRDLVLERWRPLADSLDLREPFGRIRDALEEAQRGAAGKAA